MKPVPDEITVPIYVELLDEGTFVLRPTRAIVLAKNRYRLLPTPNYNPELETWKFLPGSEVSCESQFRGNKWILVATESVGHESGSSMDGLHIQIDQPQDNSNVEEGALHPSHKLIRADFSLQVESRVHAPDAIIEAVGEEPQFWRRIGDNIDLKNPRSMIFQVNKVVFDLETDISESLVEQLSGAVDQSSELIFKMKHLTGQCEIYLNISLIDNRFDTLIDLPAEIISRLKDLGISVYWLITNNLTDDY